MPSNSAALTCTPPARSKRLRQVASLDFLDVRFEIEAAVGQIDRGLVPALRAGPPPRIDGGRLSVEHRRRRLERHRTFEHVFELADIAGPVVLHQQLHRRPRDAGHRFLHLLGVLGEEVLRQQRDVLAPLAQRRQANRNHVDPIEQIFAEAALGDRFFTDPGSSRR